MFNDNWEDEELTDLDVRKYAARRHYCHSWSPNRAWLLKSCARYKESCGDHCYREDPVTLEPICFVEPDTSSTKSLQAMSFTRPYRVNFNTTARRTSL